MPSNIELKAALQDWDKAVAIAEKLSDVPHQVIIQEDVFFSNPGARLKLRILASDRGELIRYERPDTPGMRCSRYLIARTPDPQTLLEILSKALGKFVKKARTLYLVGQTRVHLDRAEGLGDFLELEVVLRAGQSEAEGKSIAENLLSHFGIARHELIAEAYVDLLARRPNAGVLLEP
ncbi:MAG: hypothetical protein QOD84_1788 [Acidobacteriaceae bacterium]|jgi:predicted adenylyl cyclase CyaB